MRKTSLKHIYKNSLKIFTVYIHCYKLFIEISLYSLSTFNKLLKVYIYKKKIPLIFNFPLFIIYFQQTPLRFIFIKRRS